MLFPKHEGTKTQSIFQEWLFAVLGEASALKGRVKFRFLTWPFTAKQFHTSPRSIFQEFPSVYLRVLVSLCLYIVSLCLYIVPLW